MTIHAKGPPPGHGGDPLELSSLGGVDLRANIPNEALSQAENSASEITCALMRVEELRACLVREIFRAALIGMQAQTALLEGDDDLALDNLRRHWRVIRAGITPLACELLALRRAGAPP
jgi:hypothetical protein